MSDILDKIDGHKSHPPCWISSFFGTLIGLGGITYADKLITNDSSWYNQ